MKKSYYLFNPGKMSRKDNTLKFIPVDEDGNEKQPKYLPVEGVEELYLFGAMEANTALYNFLGKSQVSVHFFDYYENYTGSFMPREALLSGKLLVAQANYNFRKSKRMPLAIAFVDGGSFNMLKNLRYYDRRNKNLSLEIREIEKLRQCLPAARSIDELMGI